jgi:O-antigen/teichoic acid export membrane protein
MARLRAVQGDLLIAVGMMILPLLLYGSVTLGGNTMLPVDNLYQWPPWASAAAELGVEQPHNALLSDLILQNYVWKRFARQSLAEGQIPLWNPHAFAGVPFLAAGQHSLYYPFSWLFFILPLDQAFGWYTVSQLWLAGVLMYWFGRLLRMRRGSAALSGLIYQGSGFMLVSAAVFPMIIGAAAWLPLILGSLEMTLRRSTAVAQPGKTLPWALLSALALGFQVLAGHVEITYYTLLVMALFAGWRLLHYWQRADWRNAVGRQRITLVKPALWLLLPVSLGMMLGAIQFIPLYELVQYNFREGSVSLAEVRGWAFPPRRILTLALPNFFGNPAHHGYQDAFSGEWQPLRENYFGQPNPHGPFTSAWGIKNYVEGGIYLAILPLFLALLGLWGGWQERTRRNSMIFFVLLALASLAFIFGTPLYGLLYYGLPGINQLHSPFRWVFPLSLCAAVLAGYGADYLQGIGIGTAKRSWGLARATAVAALLSGVLLLVGLQVAHGFYGRLEPTYNQIFLNLTRAPDAFPNVRAFYSYLLPQIRFLGWMLVGSGLVIWLSQRDWRLRAVPLWLAAGAALIVLDIAWINWGFNAAVNPSLLDHRPALVDWLQEQPGEWRLTSFDPHGERPLHANAGWLYGFQDARGYDSIIPRQYTDYMSAIEPQDGLLFNRIEPIRRWESLQSPLVDLLGVRFVITTQTIDLPKYRLVWEGEGSRIYENMAVVPRAFTLPQTATAVVPDPLIAMRQHDPRQYVIIARDDIAQDEWEQPASEARAGLWQAAAVTSYRNIEVWVDVAVDESSWLILTDSYFPGWRVFVRPWGGEESEEQEQTITRVNGNFRGVSLPPGAWTLRFRYSPITFQLGGLFSLMALATILFALSVWGWRRYYHPQGELTDTRSVAKNSLVPMVLNLFNRGIDFIFAAFYLRLLGPFDAGSYATAIAIAGWFEIISNFGLNTLVIREVSRDKSQAARYLLNTTILRLGTSLIGCIPIFIYWWGISQAGNPLDSNTVAAIVLIMVGMVFSGMGQGVAGLFYAFEIAERPAAVTTITTILKVGFGVIVLLLGYGFVGLAGISIIVNVITLLILVALAVRQFGLRGPWQVDFGLQWNMVKWSYPLMLNHFFAVIFFQVDVPILQQFQGDEAVGWYNSAYKWVNAFNVIPAFFTFALFPVITRQIKDSIVSARRTFRMSAKLLLLVALPLAVVITFSAPILIQLLGGQAFLPHGAIALQVVIWSIPFGWLNSVTNYVLIALGQERIQTRAFLIGVGFNVITNLMFIPQYGYVAAAVTTILSEIVLLSVFAYYLRPKMAQVGWFKMLWRPTAVALLMLAGMWLAYQWHLLAALLAGLLIYPTGLWLFKVFTPEEQRILGGALPGKVRLRLQTHFPNLREDEV